MLGKSIGHYSVQAKLGAGGMGVVYRALDTKLKREVALKILPESFVSDPDRIARFQREAEVLASLNHPQIASIYGIEESNGTRALVLELVEGETLAERISRGPVPIGEALQMAKQVAEALEAAHEKGIVHRDLKPANIKITPDGRVKVLDFGLSKILELATPDSRDAMANSPTLISGSLGGVIIGTAAYMSPEQARGRPADRSSDIWAFGVVLYEMLTGKQAFPGETITDILGGIVKVDPDWNALPETAPPVIRSLLRRCLHKDRSRRLHDIADARIEIEEAFNAAAMPLAPERVPVKKGSQRIAWALVLVLALLAIALTIPTYRYFTPAEAAAVRFEIPLPANTNLPGAFVAAPWPVPSPDGRYVAFIAARDGVSRVWVRPLDSLEARMLSGTEGVGVNVFWSPDSRYIGFFAQGQLKKVGVDGGLQVLCDAVGANNHGTWGSADVIVFESGALLHRVPAGGGMSTVLLSPDLSRGENAYRNPYFLPNGQDFVFLSWHSSAAEREIRVSSLDGKEPKSVIKVNSRAVYAAPGYLLFILDGTLMVQPFDAENLTLNGAMTPLAESIASVSSFPDAALGASETGILTYRSNESGSSLELTSLDRAGKPIGVEPIDIFGGVSISADGRRIAFERRDLGDAEDIWVRDLLRGTDLRLTTDQSRDAGPVWSPDGNTIVFVSTRTGEEQLYRKSSNGVGSEQPLNQPGSPNDWSGDGQFILFTVNNDVWVFPWAAENQKPSPVLNSPFAEGRARFSPDGKFIAYTSDESGRNEIYVQPFPPTGSREPISVDGGEFAYWRADGKELFFTTVNGRIMAVNVTLGAALEAEVPRPLFEVPNMANGRFVVTPEQRFLFALRPEQTQRPTITTILNWTALLRK